MLLVLRACDSPAQVGAPGTRSFLAFFLLPSGTRIPPDASGLVLVYAPPAEGVHGPGMTVFWEGSSVCRAYLQFRLRRLLLLRISSYSRIPTIYHATRMLVCYNGAARGAVSRGGRLSIVHTLSRGRHSRPLRPGNSPPVALRATLHDSSTVGHTLTAVQIPSYYATKSSRQVDPCRASCQ